MNRREILDRSIGRNSQVNFDAAFLMVFADFLIS